MSDTHTIVYAALAALAAVYIIKWTTDPVCRHYRLACKRFINLLRVVSAAFHTHCGRPLSPHLLLPRRAQLQSEPEAANR